MVIRPVPGPWRLPPALHVRARYVGAVEWVRFVAPCPCGRDAEWVQRLDRKNVEIECPCQPKENAA